MAEKKAFVKQVKGITFIGKADSGHWITMDGPENSGGGNSAVRPKELLLLGLGGCTGSDVATILQKKRVNLEGFELNISSDTQEEHPQVFTKIHIEYVFYGKAINPSDVERAIELSMTKYCSVTAMLSKAMPITHSFRIEETK